MKLLVFIPAYNEESTIGLVIDNIKKVFESEYINGTFSEKIILVINDSSSDATEQVALSKGAVVHTLKGKSEGVGRVIKLGLEKILELKPDIAVGIDADGQFDANDIPKLIAPLFTKGADMVTGSKFTDRKNPPEGLKKIKLHGNYLVIKLVNFLLKSKFTDVSCGFRAYNRKALLSLNIWGKRTYVQETFIELHCKGLVINEVPITAKYFQDRKSRVFRFSGGVLNYAFRSLLILLRATRDYKAFEFFGSIALVFFLISIIPGAILFIHYFINGTFSPYIFLGFISGGLFVFSMFLVIIALLGDMISRLKQNQEKLLFLEKASIYNINL